MSKTSTTSPDQGDKNWFLKHKFVTGILVIVLFAIIGTALGSDGSNSTASTAGGSADDKKEVTIASTSFDDFSIVCDMNATSLQKQNEFNNKFKDKYVQWSGTVSSVGESLGSYTLQVKHCPNTLVSDIVVTMKDDQKEKLLTLKEGDKVTYKAKLTRLGDLLGLSADNGELVQ